MHLKFMKEAIAEAKKGLKEHGIPIGSVLVLDGQVIGRGHNKRVQKSDPILHAEMVAIEAAGRLHSHDYHKCTLYTTLTPCDMCLGAILLYKIPIVVTGENENFHGHESYGKRRGIHFINLDLDECKKMMKKFIQNNHELWFEDIGKY